MAANILTRDKAEAIRARYGAGGLSQQSIAAEFGVSQVLVSKIVRGELWRVMTNCKVCDTIFEPDSSTHAYCSASCFDEGRRRRYRANWARNNPKPTGRICPHCGEGVPDERTAQASYCSQKCEQAAHNATRKASWRVGERQERVSRAYIIERDGGRCHLCGAKPVPADIHLDHLVPLALGGTHDEANLRVACSACNLAKGARARNEQLLLIG